MIMYEMRLDREVQDLKQRVKALEELVEDLVTKLEEAKNA